MILLALCLLFILGGARLLPYPSVVTVKSTDVISVNPSQVISSLGYGSDLDKHPHKVGHFYLLTDRGPNFDSADDEDIKVFPVQTFTPRIVEVSFNGQEFEIINEIWIRDADGKLSNGLPPLAATGVTEMAIDMNGLLLASDALGIDPEGLAVSKSGEFWVSEEYGPSLLHLDSAGRLIKQIKPGNGQWQLPLVWQNRAPNKGIEGLCLTPNDKYLVGTMQTALHNPNSSVKSRLLRLCRINMATGEVEEYAFLQEEAGLSCSGITAISDTKFLIIERDSKPGSTSKYKRVYEIDISEASNIVDASYSSPFGRLVNDRSLESLSPDELAEAGIKLASKKLRVDLLSQLPRYPYRKAEGIVRVNGHVAIVNDNDFALFGENETRFHFYKL